jgi:hypothetical protein
MGFPSMARRIDGKLTRPLQKAPPKMRHERWPLKLSG